MKKSTLEAWELMWMTLACIIAAVVAICIDHPRTEFIIGLTILMGVMVLLARLRRNRRVHTLNATGRRRQTRKEED